MVRMITKKRRKDGKLITMSNWGILPLSIQERFDDVEQVPIPEAIIKRTVENVEPIKKAVRGRRKA